MKTMVMGHCKCIVLCLLFVFVYLISCSLSFMGYTGYPKVFCSCQKRKVGKFLVHQICCFPPPVDQMTVWRPLACTLLRSLGGLDMDRSLFLMDPKTLSTQRLPCSYCGVFKVLSLFKIQREASSSLCWLLQEPLIRGARLDVSAGMMPSLDNILSNKGVNTFRDLVTVAAPTLNNAENLSSILGIRSLRIVTQFLNKVKDTLTEREKAMLQS